MADKFDDLNNDFDFDSLDSIIEMDDAGPRESSGGLVKTAVTGFIDDFRDTPITDTIRKGISDALPTIIGSETASKLDNSVSSFRKTISDTTQELRSHAKPILNKIDKILPEKGITRKIFNKVNSSVGKEESSYSFGPSQEQMQQEEIEYLVSQAIKSNNAEQRKELLNQYMNFSMSVTTEEKLSSISVNTQLQQEFNNKVTSEYYKKSLELQFKQLYVSRDTKDILRLGFDTLTKLSDSIVKNTGLPDFVKLKSSEALTQKFRQTIIGNVEKKLFLNNDGLQKALGAIKDNLTKYTSNLVNVLSGTKDAMEMSEGAEEMGISKGSLAGSTGAGFIKEKIASFFGRELKSTSTGKRASGRIRNFLTDPSEFFRNASESSNNKIGRSIFSFLSKITHDSSAGTSSTTIERDNPDDTVVFDGRTKLSITRIIPGILYKILKEVTTIRTGKVADEIRYDYEKDDFITSRTFKRDFVRELRHNFKSEGVDKSIIRMIKDLSTKTGIKLSRNETTELSKAIYNYSLTGHPINPDYLSKYGFYDDLEPNLAIKIKMMFKRFSETELGFDDNDSKQSLINNLTSIRASLKDPKDRINDLIHSGRADELRELGVVKYDSKLRRNVIDLKRFNEINRSAGIQSINSEYNKIDEYSETSFSEDEEESYIKSAVNKLNNVKIGEVLDSVTGKKIEITTKIKNKYNGSFIQKFIGKREKAFRREVGLKLKIPFTDKKKFYAILEERVKNNNTAKEVNSLLEKHAPKNKKSFIASLYSDLHIEESVNNFKKRINEELKLHKEDTVKDIASNAVGSAKEKIIKRINRFKNFDVDKKVDEFKQKLEKLNFSPNKIEEMAEQYKISIFNKLKLNKDFDVKKEADKIINKFKNFKTSDVNLKDRFDKAENKANSTYDSVKENTTNAIEDIKNYESKIIETTRDKVKKAKESVKNKLEPVTDYLENKYEDSVESEIVNKSKNLFKRTHRSATDLLIEKFTKLTEIISSNTNEQKKENELREEELEETKKENKKKNRENDEFERFSLFSRNKKNSNKDDSLFENTGKSKNSFLSMLPGILGAVVAAPFKLIGTMSDVLTNTLGGVLTVGNTIAGAGFVMSKLVKLITFGSKKVWSALKFIPKVIAGLSVLAKTMYGGTLNRLGSKFGGSRVAKFFKNNKKLAAVAALAAPTMLEGSDEVNGELDMSNESFSEMPDFENMNDKEINDFLNSVDKEDSNRNNYNFTDTDTDNDNTAVTDALLGTAVLSGVEGATHLAHKRKINAAKKSAKAIEASKRLGLKPLAPVAKDIASKKSVIKTFEAMGKKALVIKDADAVRKTIKGVLEVRKILPKGGFKWVKLGKGIPVAGLVLAGGFAASRVMEGDLAGAGLELLSGAAATVPLYGTALFVALEGYIMYRDATRAEKAVIGEDGGPLMSWEWLHKSIDWIDEKATDTGKWLGEKYDDASEYSKEVYNDTTTYMGNVYDNWFGNKTTSLDTITTPTTVSTGSPKLMENYSTLTPTLNRLNNTQPVTNNLISPIDKSVSKEKTRDKADTIVGASTALVKDTSDSGIFKDQIVRATALIIRKVESRNIYNTVAVLADGAGISFGGYQLTEKSGSLLAFMKQLLKLNPPFAESTKAHLSNFKGNWYIGSKHKFKIWLKQVGATPLGIKAQDLVFYNNYYIPGAKLASRFKNPMVILHIIDSLHNGGTKSVIKRVKEDTLASIEQARLSYWQSLSGWKKFGRGWTNRLIEIKNLAKKYLTGAIGGGGIDLEAVGAGVKLTGDAVMPGASKAIGGPLGELVEGIDNITEFFGAKTKISDLITKTSEETSKIIPNINKVKAVETDTKESYIDLSAKDKPVNFSNNIKVKDTPQNQGIKVTSEVNDFTVDAEKKKIGSLFTMEEVLKRSLEKQSELVDVVNKLLEVNSLVPASLNDIGVKLDKNGKPLPSTVPVSRGKEVSVSRGSYER